MKMEAGNVRLYDVQTGEVKSTLTGQDAPVTQVEFIDADTVVSSSNDGTTRAWDVATGTPIALWGGQKRESTLIGEPGNPFHGNPVAEESLRAETMTTPLNIRTPARERQGLDCEKGWLCF